MCGLAHKGKKNRWGEGVFLIEIRIGQVKNETLHGYLKEKGG